MQIALEDGTPLRGDTILRAVQRFDLTPVPSTLELALRSDSSLSPSIKEGAVLMAGPDRYRLVKVRRATSDWVQGAKDAAQVIEATGILDGVFALASPLPRAVVKDQCTLGEVFKSCGATARVGDDIPAARFACFAGSFPTEAIAMVLQEEAAVVVWRPGGALAFVRLADLFKGDPAEAIEHDTTQAVESDFLSRHGTPWAMSNAPSGAVITGRRDGAAAFVFLPRTSARVLDNMTRALMVSRVLTSTYAPTIRAGDGFDIAGVRHVVATAAHCWDNGSGGGAPAQTSRFWLAQLQR